MSLKHDLFSSTTFLTLLACSVSASAENLVLIVEYTSKFYCLNGPNNQESDYIKDIKDDGDKKQNIIFSVCKLLYVHFNDKCVFELNVIQPVINVSIFFIHDQFPLKISKAV